MRGWLAITGVLATLLLGATPAAAATALSEVTLDGAFRAGQDFAQTYSATGSELNSATHTVLIEPLRESNPGTISASAPVIQTTTLITGSLFNASASGQYFLRLCVTPKATPSCATATTTRVFAITVGGAPTVIEASPASTTVPADTVARFDIALRDASGTATQLSSVETIDPGVVTTGGVADLPYVDALATDLRRVGAGTLSVVNDTPGTGTTVTLAAAGFSAPAAAVELLTDPIPGAVQVRLVPDVIAARPGSTVTVSGVVVNDSGTPIAGAAVTGVVDGVNDTTTSSATSDSEGTFALTYVAGASAPSGSRDSVRVIADAGPAGTGTASAEVILTPDGRTRISDLRIDGVPAGSFAEPVDVAFDGVATTGIDAVAVTVVAEVPGATVTISASGALVSATDDIAWNSGQPSVDVPSNAATGIATAYVFARRAGVARVTAAASGSISSDVVFRTRPAAARNIALAASATRVRAGQSVTLLASVTDVFGNPVPQARITLALTGVGRFASGARTLTAVADSRGIVTADASARTGESGAMTVTVAGDAPACARGLNQYACAAGRPAAGFAAASGARRTTITVTPYSPSVLVTAPKPSTAVSYNQWVTVTATARDIASGTQVRLIQGGRAIAVTTVGAQGAIRFTKVRAQGDGTYRVDAGVAVEGFGLRVRDFGITAVTKKRKKLTFGVRTGAWAVGTVITLTRDKKKVAKAKVVKRGTALSVTVTRRSGDYQVIVKTPDGKVPGRAPRYVP